MFFQKQIYVCVVQHFSLKTSRIISAFWEMLLLEPGCETIRLSWAFSIFLFHDQLYMKAFGLLHQQVQRWVGRHFQVKE